MQLACTKRIYPSFSLAVAICAATTISVQAQSVDPVPPSVLEQLKVETPSQPFFSGTVPTAAEPQPLPIAQTRSEPESELLSSYIGIGGNLGIEGEDSALREDNFAIISKTGLTKNISVHNTAIIGDDTTFTFAATYGIPIEDLGDEILDEAFVAPFIFAGGGVMFTVDEFDLKLLATTGIDFPVAPDLTGTLRLNFGFLDNTEIGLVFGVGYNFNVLDFFD